MCGIVGYIGPRQAAPILLEGLARLEYRGYDSAGIALVTAAGEMFVIPNGLEHKTSATVECRAMLVEKAGTANTGEVVSAQTAASDAWI